MLFLSYIRYNKGFNNGFFPGGGPFIGDGSLHESWPIERKLSKVTKRKYKKLSYLKPFTDYRATESEYCYWDLREPCYLDCMSGKMADINRVVGTLWKDVSLRLMI